jgi:hypothetical protein
MFQPRLLIGLTFPPPPHALLSLTPPYSLQMYSVIVYLITLSGRHTLGRDPLVEGSAHCIDLYLATHNTQKRQILMSPLGFDPAIPSYKRLQTHALDRATTIGLKTISNVKTETHNTPHQNRLIQYEI